MKYKIIILPVTFLLLAISSLFAGRNESAQAHVRIEFTAIGLGMEIPKILYFINGKAEDISIPLFGRSETKQYLGASELIFYMPVEVTGEPDSFRPVGTVILPENVDRMLLVFIPDGEGYWGILPLSDSIESFPLGHARIVNTTSQNLVIKARDSAPHALAPGAQVLLSGNGINLGIQLANEVGGRWQLVTSGIFALKKHYRRTIFLIESDSDYFKISTFEGTKISSASIQMLSVPD